MIQQCEKKESSAAETSNIAGAFVEAAIKNAGKTAIIDAATKKSISFADLDKRADGYALYFRQQGMQPGDIVSLMVTPSIDFIAITIALFKLGTPIVLIDPGMGYKNLLRCIERVAPKYLVGVPKACLFAKVFRGAFASVEQIFCVAKWRSFGLLGKDVRPILKTESTPFPVYAAALTELAAIIFTTGSTGPPKGVCYEHAVFAAQLRLIREYYQIVTTDIDQPAFPLFALFSTALGACAVIPDMDPTRPAQVDPAKFVDSINGYGVTYSFGSPAIWNVVSRYCLEKGIVLPSLQKVLMAGAPVSYSLLQRMQQILPETADIYTPYGATESLPSLNIEAREIVAETAERSRRGGGTCVGRPLPGIAVRIIAIEEGEIADIAQAKALPIGEIGEIIISGDVVTRKYMNNEAETSLAKIADRDSDNTHGFWHRMGDVGYLDKKGRIWFCGRKAHRVVAGEKTWFSISCEAIINEHPALFRSALVGVINREGRVEPAFCLEFLPGVARKREMVAEITQLAAASPLTSDISHFLEHSGFPVDIRHNAKIFREKLALWAQQQLYPEK